MSRLFTSAAERERWLTEQAQSATVNRPFLYLLGKTLSDKDQGEYEQAVAAIQERVTNYPESKIWTMSSLVEFVKVANEVEHVLSGGETFKEDQGGEALAQLRRDLSELVRADIEDSPAVLHIKRDGSQGSIQEVVARSIKEILIKAEKDGVLESINPQVRRGNFTFQDMHHSSIKEWRLELVTPTDARPGVELIVHDISSTGSTYILARMSAPHKMLIQLHEKEMDKYADFFIQKLSEEGLEARLIGAMRKQWGSYNYSIFQPRSFDGKLELSDVLPDLSRYLNHSEATSLQKRLVTELGYALLESGLMKAPFEKTQTTLFFDELSRSGKADSKMYSVWFQIDNASLRALALELGAPLNSIITEVVSAPGANFKNATQVALKVSERMSGALKAQFSQKEVMDYVELLYEEALRASSQILLLGMARGGADNSSEE